METLAWSDAPYGCRLFPQSTAAPRSQQELSTTFRIPDAPFVISQRPTKFPSPFGEGEAPRTLCELKMLTMLGAVRDKPRWWTKVYLVAAATHVAPDEISEADASVDDFHTEEGRQSRANILHKWMLEMAALGATRAQLDFVRAELESELSLMQDGPRSYGTLRDVFDAEQPPRAAVSVVRRGAVEGTFLRDHGMSERVHATLAAGFAALAAQEPRDWHPGSNEMVLDLVHPSLYCYERGATRVTGLASEEPFEAKLEREAWGDEPGPSYDRPRPVEEEPLRGYYAEPPTMDEWTSRHGLAWLPAEFRVSDDGSSCTIASYINNLRACGVIEPRSTLRVAGVRTRIAVPASLSTHRCPSVRVRRPAEVCRAVRRDRRRVRRGRAPPRARAYQAAHADAAARHAHQVHDGCVGARRWR